MHSGIELVVYREDVTAHAVSVGLGRFSVGRGPDNDLVIPDERVSWHHALVWVEHGAAWVRDLSSRNGTFVNGERATVAVEVKDGDRIRLGPAVELGVRGKPLLRPMLQLRALALEEVTTGFRHPLRSDRFVIGTGEAVDLRITDGPEVLATLLVQPDGEVWLGRDEEDEPLQIGPDYDLGAIRFRLIEVDATHAPTVQPAPQRGEGGERYPYQLAVDLNAATGSVAILRHQHTRVEVRVDADNRAVLLYLLGKKYGEDRQAGSSVAERGWCADDDLIRGVWGRVASGDGPNRLNVLVHRLRRQLKSAGFDPWCIEKRRRYTRGRFAEVEVK